MKIALVTYAADPGLTPDDELLAEALRARGAAPEPLPWDQPADWAGFDLVVLRSTWDYYLRSEEFASWIDSLDRLGVRVVNSPAIARWNGDKRYLFQLEAAGIAIVPTVGVALPGERGGTTTLGDVLRANGWDEVVVKPVVSAAGHETWRASRRSAAADEARFAALCRSAPGGVFVQPFVPEVMAEGEWSLLFIDGAYSHAAIKRPRAGSFLVQNVHGGTYAPASPSLEVIEDAGRVLAAAARCAGVGIADFAYARVDGVVRRDGAGERLVLMELECLEPSLFFLQAPEAADRMAAALVARTVADTARTPYLR